MTKEDLKQLIDSIVRTQSEVQRLFHQVEEVKEMIDYHQSEIEQSRNDLDRSLQSFIISQQHTDTGFEIALEKLHQLVHEQENPSDD